MEDTLAAGRRFTVIVVLCVFSFLLTPVGGPLPLLAQGLDGGNPSLSGLGGCAPISLFSLAPRFAMALCRDLGLLNSTIRILSGAPQLEDPDLEWTPQLEDHPGGT